MSSDSLKELEYQSGYQPVSYEPPGNEQNNMRDFLTILFKHKIKMAIVFSVIVLAAAIGSFLITPVYEAKSILLMKLGREHLNRSDLGDAGSLALRQEEIINSEIEILTNGELIKKVVATIGPEQLYPDLAKKPAPRVNPVDAAASRLRRDLRVDSVKKSNVVQVSFKHTDPQVAAKTVNLLVDLFKEKHLQVFSDPKSSFFETQLAVYQQKLQDSANNLQQFKQKNQVYSLEEQRSLLLKQRTDLDTLLKTSLYNIEELQKRQGTLKRQIKTLSSSTSSYTSTELDKILTEAKSRLLSLQINERELSQKYNDNNQLVQSTRSEISMVKDFIKQQEQEINVKMRSATPVYQGVETDMMRTEAELTSQRARAAALRQQLRQVDGQIQSLDSREKDLQNLKREFLVNEKNHQVYLDKTEEARIAENMNRKKLANIGVIQAASAPLEPIKPKKQLNILLAIFVGALSSVGMAFLLEKISQSVSTPESVEKRLGLTVMAVIPYKE